MSNILRGSIWLPDADFFWNIPCPNKVGSLSLAAHLVRFWVASLSPFYRYYFGRLMAQLAQKDYGSTGYTSFSLERGLLVILIDRMIFLSSFLDVTRMSTSTFFPCIAGFWNSLPVECFHLTYDLSGYKSRINRYLLTAGYF